MTIQEAIELHMELNGLPLELMELQKAPFNGLLNEKMDMHSKSILHDLSQSIKSHMMQYKDMDEIDLKKIIDVNCDPYVEEIISSDCLKNIVSDLYCPTFFQILYR